MARDKGDRGPFKRAEDLWVRMKAIPSRFESMTGLFNQPWEISALYTKDGGYFGETKIYGKEFLGHIIGNTGPMVSS